MTNKNGLFLVSMILFCLATPVLLSCISGTAIAQGTQTKELFYQEIEAAIDKALFFVAYDKRTGEPTKIIASPGANVRMTGEDLSADFIKILKELEAKGEKLVETQCETSFYVHGSPGCRIKKTASGGYKVICD
jgi:hypothetical protein